MGMLTPLAIRIGSFSWLPRLLPKITWLDKLIHRLTRGHWSLLRLAGLPTLMLTSRGRSHHAEAHELSGPERTEARQHMLQTWPNYANYAERTDRVIPVFWLTAA